MEQAVLGASGNIGGLLVEELLRRDIGVRALARNWPPDKQREHVTYTAVDAEHLFEVYASTHPRA